MHCHIPQTSTHRAELNCTPHDDDRRHGCNYCLQLQELSSQIPPKKCSNPLPLKYMTSLSRLSKKYPNPPHLKHNTLLSRPPKPSRLSGVPAAEHVTALYDYEAQAEGDLSFVTGDVIEIVSRTQNDNEWWIGKVRGKQGQFPGMLRARTNCS